MERPLCRWLFLSVGILVSLLATTLKTKTLGMKNSIVFSIALLTVTAATGWAAMNWQQSAIYPLAGVIGIDGITSFFTILLGVAGILILLKGYWYLCEQKIDYPEYYPIFLVVLLGMICLVASHELITLFISLEVMSLGIYVLVGMRRRDKRANEAALKYFILGGVASAIFLYGVSFVYGALNTTYIVSIAAMIQEGGVIIQNPILLIGIVLMMVGMFFKVALVPFHMWTPDVYEGAPMMVTSFMSTAVKAATFGAFIRISGVFLGTNGPTIFGQSGNPVYEILWWLALVTMIFGNLVALRQDNLKRMLAYSAIAHTGYLMVGIIVAPTVGVSSVLLYLIPYSMMNIGAFGVLAAFSGKMDQTSTIDNMKGVGFAYPFWGFAFSIFLLGLAGMPPTGGFVGKYLLFSAGLQGGETLLVFIGILTSLISVYYYLRVIIFMYMKEPEGSTVVSATILRSKLARLSLVVCLAIVLQFGVYPGKLIEVAKEAVASSELTRGLVAHVE